MVNLGHAAVAVLPSPVLPDTSEARDIGRRRILHVPVAAGRTERSRRGQVVLGQVFSMIFPQQVFGRNANFQHLLENVVYPLAGV